ncbi:MAG: DNA-binding protein [Undibacterium umbellatum]|uniref:DNA-binding protein n=1 Tax=Undibacterium umbellatum TaxID=2762300 RepID=UPI003BB59FE4
MNKSIDKANAYSASEILAMHLPGLPTTIANIHARAKSEGWPYTTKVGLGGTRKLYEVPGHYLTDKKADQVSGAPSRQESHNIVGAIADGEQVNTARLASAIRALDEYLTENNLVIDDPDRKAEIVTFLYKYLEKKASEGDVKELLHLVTG